MSRYRVTIRETLTVEYEVEVEADGEGKAYRLAEDSAQWIEADRPWIEIDGVDDDNLDFCVLSAEKVEESDES